MRAEEERKSEIAWRRRRRCGGGKVWCRDRSGACLSSSLSCLCTPRLADIILAALPGRVSSRLPQGSLSLFLFLLTIGPSPSFPYGLTPPSVSLPTLNHRFTTFHATWGSHCARFHGHWEAPCVMCFKVSRPWCRITPSFQWEAKWPLLDFTAQAPI